MNTTPTYVPLTPDEIAAVYDVLFPTSDVDAIRARVLPVVEQIMADRTASLQAALAALVEENCPSHTEFSASCPVCRAVQLLERLP